MAITPYRPTTELFRTIFDDLPGLGTGLGGRMGGWTCFEPRMPT